MQYGKALLIFLTTVSGLLPGLCGSTAVFAEEQESAPFRATAQERAAVFLREEVSGLMEPVLSDFPEDAYVTLIAAKFYGQCKNPRKVMSLLEEGLTYHPENFNLNNMAAKVAFSNGDYEKAVRFGQKAVAINPRNPGVHEDLAEAMLYSGQYQQAVDCLDKKITLLGASERTYRLLGKGHSFLKNYEKAIDYYEKADQINPGSTIADYSILSKLYMRLKQPEKAKEYMKRHDEMTAQKKDRDLEDAKKQKDRVVLDSTDSEVLVFSRALARLCIQGSKLYINKQQSDKAQTLFRNSENIFTESIMIAPDTADIYREFADMYVTTGKDLSKAVPLAQKCTLLEGSAENYFVLGRAFYNNSDTDKALLALEQALKLDPKNRAIRQAYGAIMEKSLK